MSCQYTFHSSPFPPSICIWSYLVSRPLPLSLPRPPLRPLPLSADISIEFAFRISLYVPQLDRTRLKSWEGCGVYGMGRGEDSGWPPIAPHEMQYHIRSYQIMSHQIRSHLMIGWDQIRSDQISSDDRMRSDQIRSDQIRSDQHSTYHLVNLLLSYCTVAPLLRALLHSLFYSFVFMHPTQSTIPVIAVINYRHISINIFINIFIFFSLFSLHHITHWSKCWLLYR